MKLMTKEIEGKLEQIGLFPETDSMLEAEVIVKYFNPCGAATWLVVGGERTEDDWELYGYATLGHGWEWGSVMLSELESYKGPFLIGIERDLYCAGKCVKELVE
ncbi:MAG: DUF2958 domain-containing protein [Lachnospiraceae bacterium]|nr:DUF2958 domain-containing protein [Lachnospiraceae bacterium]